MSTAQEKLKEVRFGEVIRTLWPVLRKFRWQFLAGFSLILMNTAIEVVFPILIGRITDFAVTHQANLRGLYRLCTVFLGLLLLKGSLEMIQAYVIQIAGQGMTHELRAGLFSRIVRLPVEYFDQHPTGRLLTRVINDIKSLSELFTASFSVLALDALVIVGTVGAMFWMEPRLAAVVLSTFPLVIITVKVFGDRLAIAYREVRLKLAEINAFLGENIAAIATIQRLAAEKVRFERFQAIVDAHRSAQLRSVGEFAKVQPLANLLNGFAIAVLIGYGGKLVVEGELTVGVIVAFLGYLRNLFQPIRDLVEKYNTFLSAMVSAERVVNIMREPIEEEGKSGEPIAQRSSVSLKFDHVSFRYPTREEEAITDLSFELTPGSSTAIVGATGSGKSTLIRLLLRFYEPTRGSIFLNGRSLREWNKRDLRTLVGVVHQEIYLFEGTVRDNLTLGLRNLSDDHLIETLAKVQLWDSLAKRGGLDLRILEGGTNLSVGERQLLSFARIIVLDCPMLVMDEASSSIDRGIEMKLMEAVQEMLKGRTSIVIAHRLSTIQHCDSIMVMSQGRLVEQGTFDELLSRDGVFKRFHHIFERGSEPSLTP